MLEKFYKNATFSDIEDATMDIDEVLENMDCPMKVQVQLDIAIDEIFSNIIRYAYGNESGETKILLEETKPLGVCISFIDRGVYYNPLEHKDPNLELSTDDKTIGGLGIFMVKKTMDALEYSRKDGKNILKLTKYF